MARKTYVPSKTHLSTVGMAAKGREKNTRAGQAALRLRREARYRYLMEDFGKPPHDEVEQARLDAEAKIFPVKRLPYKGPKRN